MHDQKFVAASAIALVVTLAGIFWMRPLARRVGLVDRPSGRKRHQGTVPLVGGLCFFIGTGVGLVYYAPPDRFTASLLGVGAFIVLIGLIDDLEDLSARSRLLIQAAACTLMIATTGVYVETLGPLLGEDPLQLHVFGIPLTILAVVGLVNAFNMLDGIDGLAGSMALVSIIAILTYASADWPGTGATVPLQMLGLTLVPYLLVNLGWPDGRRIFMGDAGSTLLGFVLAFSVIKLSQPNGEPLAPVDALWCVALPAMDILMVMYRRLRRGLSPFKPDRRHLHYRLLDAGFSPRVSLALITALATMLVGTGYLLRDVAEPVSLAVFLACLVLYVTRVSALVAWLSGFVHGPAAMRRQAAFQRYRARWAYGGMSGRKALRSARTHAAARHARLPAALAALDDAAPGQGDSAGNSAGDGTAAQDDARAKALCVFGAAAEYAEIAPIVRRLGSDRRFRTRICIAAPSAAQRAQLLRSAASEADLDLQIVPQEPDDAGSSQIVAAMGSMKREFAAFAPDIVVTYGDSPGVLASALIAHDQQLPIARLARSSRPEDHDELGAHIVRLLSTRRFPAAGQGSEAHAVHDAQPHRDAALSGIRIDTDRAGESAGCEQILDALLELSQQPPAVDPAPTQAARAAQAAAAQRLSASAETN